VGLTHFAPNSLLLRARPLILLLCPVQLERPENNDIEALVNMCCMRGVANDVDSMFPRKVEEGFSEMGKVAINGENSSLPIRLILCLLVKIFNIFQIDLAVNPAFSGVPKPAFNSVPSHTMGTW
jgi:hypothetical protein